MTRNYYRLLAEDEKQTEKGVGSRGWGVDRRAVGILHTISDTRHPTPKN
jgi:hypothetical protein